MTFDQMAGTESRVLQYLTWSCNQNVFYMQLLLSMSFVFFIFSVYCS